MHKANKHKRKYDFKKLKLAIPELEKYVKKNPKGEYTIDFGNDRAVKLLNTALLKSDYGIKYWDFPTGHLCPPVPGRADYIHYLHDLLTAQKNIPNTNYILDIGTGASIIYPILGCKIYGWQFKASDISTESLKNAEKIIAGNHLEECIHLAYQKKTKQILKDIILPGEKFMATMCNPPFYASEIAAKKANLRKNKALNLTRDGRNFKGLPNELWIDGGEVQFIKTYIDESILYKNQVGLYTTLVAYQKHIPILVRYLRRNKIKNFDLTSFGQGQKSAHILSWHF